MIEESKKFDVVIIGGGPAGISAGISLARNGLKVAILEKTNYEQIRIGETLHPSIRPLLTELGIWSDFQFVPSIISHGIKSSWGGNNLTTHSFLVNPYGVGWHIDRQKFDKILVNTVSNFGVKIFTNVSFAKCVAKPNHEWIVEFYKKNHHTNYCQSHSLDAEAIIDATGRNSSLSTKFGAEKIIYDNLIGLAVQFQKPKEIDHFTLIEACKEGWWYSAQLPDNRLIVIFMTDTDLVAKYNITNIRKWMNLLRSSKYTSNRCNKLKYLWGPNFFPAFSQRLQRHYSEEKWLAVGDSAIGVDPLSSSGIFNAIKSGYEGGKAIFQWLMGDKSYSDLYEQMLDKRLNEYLIQRRYYYSMEKRWENSLFWRRRKLILTEKFCNFFKLK
jgi:flavin-dependent dehydrogenase